VAAATPAGRRRRAAFAGRDARAARRRAERERHPGIAVWCADALAERTLGAVRAGEVDLSRCTSAPPHDRELVFAPLLADRMMAVLPRTACAGARRRSCGSRDLLATPLVLMDRESSVRRLVDAASASIGSARHARLPYDGSVSGRGGGDGDRAGDVR
jgi:hypothetical protein